MPSRTVQTKYIDLSISPLDSPLLCKGGERSDVCGLEKQRLRHRLAALLKILAQGLGGSIGGFQAQGMRHVVGGGG